MKKKKLNMMLIYT